MVKRKKRKGVASKVKEGGPKKAEEKPSDKIEFNIDPWKVTTAIFLLLFAASLFHTLTLKCGSEELNAGTLEKEKAVNQAVDFINTYILKGAATASAENISEENGLYKFVLNVGGQRFESYVTKDGKLLFPQSIDISKTPETPESTSSEVPKVQKSDVPEVNLFVMSYCPYGLQAEKAMIPVMKLLGDKANININFVYYAMHGKKEVDENLRQYCIQKVEREKYLDYLECFVQSGDYEKCLGEAAIDENKLDECMKETDEKYNVTEMYNDRSTWLNGRFPVFSPEMELNQKYGVAGSPTLVVNGAKVEGVARSPEAFKQVVCNAFNEAPEECNTKLSSTPTSPGIGPLSGSASAGSSGGQCG